MYDVVVVGSGPAGWALGAACARRGLATALLAPDPAAVWPATYGLWDDQADGVPSVAATRVRAAGRELVRGYRVLDNAAALAAWSSTGVETVPAAAVGMADGVVGLDDGRELRAGVVVDATGHRAGIAEQTAAGVVLDAEAAAPLVPPGTAVFMDDWNTAGGLATFLYAVPLPGGRTLVEETCLASRPGVPDDVLRARLAARLAAAGVHAAPSGTERVRFPMGAPARGGGPAVAFGSAAGMTHPATGYGVGDAIAAAPAVADAITRGPAAARAAVWPRRARLAHRLRRHGLRALLALEPAALPEFFALFFALPEHHQRAYLSGRCDAAGTAAAMTALFAAAPWGMRRSMAILR